jgi:hypothetical protein
MSDLTICDLHRMGAIPLPAIAQHKPLIFRGVIVGELCTELNAVEPFRHRKHLVAHFTVGVIVESLVVVHGSEFLPVFLFRLYN